MEVELSARAGPEPQELRPQVGDKLIVRKAGSSLAGNTATVLEADWNGMVKVDCDGVIKSYPVADLEAAPKKFSTPRTKRDAIMALYKTDSPATAVRLFCRRPPACIVQRARWRARAHLLLLRRLLLVRCLPWLNAFVAVVCCRLVVVCVRMCACARVRPRRS